MSEPALAVQPGRRDAGAATCAVAEVNVLQPTFLIGQDLKERKLVEVLPEFRSIELGIYAVYPTRRFLLPRVRAIVDFLAQYFMKPRWPA